MIHVELYNESLDPSCPSVAQIEHWVRVTLEQKVTQANLAIKILNEVDMQALNFTYRQKPKPTNVLSFPSQLPPDLRDHFLGDLAICAPVVRQEALSQNKSFESHFAHLVVHGTLHLLGFDHESPQDAQKMETEEIRILHALGFSNPYLTEITHD